MESPARNGPPRRRLSRCVPRPSRKKRFAAARERLRREPAALVVHRDGQGQGIPLAARSKVRHAPPCTPPWAGAWSKALPTRFMPARTSASRSASISAEAARASKAGVRRTCSPGAHGVGQALGLARQGAGERFCCKGRACAVRRAFPGGGDDALHVVVQLARGLRGGKRGGSQILLRAGVFRQILGVRPHHREGRSSGRGRVRQPARAALPRRASRASSDS